MEPKRWPIIPDHITNDGEGSTNPELKLLTGVGIISNKQLQGLQSSICINLGNPTTIIEFSPDGKPVRTDSQSLDYFLHPSCRKFRGLTGVKYCYKCDDTHALLFHGLSKANLEAEISSRLANSPSIQAYDYVPGIVKPSIRKCCLTDRLYLEYDCPQLGYRELVFPIFFDQKVIAVFFLGQLLLNEKIDAIPQQQALFFSLNPGIGTHILEQVENAHQEWVARSGAIDPDQYTNIINRACSELNDLEKFLVQQVEAQRERFVREHIDTQIAGFQKALPASFEISKDNLGELWKNMEARLKDIVDGFALQFVIVFGIKSYPTSEKAPLEVVVKAGNLPENILAILDNLHYDSGLVKQYTGSIPVVSDNCPELFQGLKGLPENSEIDNLRLRFFPVGLFSTGSLVILIGYCSDNPANSDANKIGGWIDRSAYSFYAIVRSALSSTLAAYAKAKSDETLRVIGHEVGQLTAGLDLLRAVYLSSPQTIKALPDKKIEDINQDIDAYIKQIGFLSAQAGMTVTSRSPQKEYIKPYRDLLFKWKDLYRFEAERKKLQISIPHPSQGESMQDVYGDKKLLEQLIYNLVNNAVKYCYRGTKIHLDCKKLSKDQKAPSLFTVINYGIAVDGGNRIYERDFRGKNVSGQAGVGIGLFVAKQIVENHGGRIKHESEMVSRFNVPLMEPFINFSLWSENLYQEVKVEFERLRASGEYSQIIAFDERGRLKFDNPPFLELQESITKPTYRVTFTVTIPSEGGKK
jgi:signal transduction histidine kinase